MSIHKSILNSGPRKLPSGWWEGVPEYIRTLFDRKVLRQGYILNTDQVVLSRNFFRKVHQGLIREDMGDFVCLYRGISKASKLDFRSNVKCTCMVKVGAQPCRHLAALLFNVYSGPIATPLSDSYPGSLWFHLALCLCRSHFDATSIQIENDAHRTVVKNGRGIPILMLGTQPENPRPWPGENLLPHHWETTNTPAFPWSETFLDFARKEIEFTEKRTLLTLGNTPSLRAEFGPIGELCRQGFLIGQKVQGRLDWSFTERCFNLYLEDPTSGLEGFARLAFEHGYSLHKKVPAIRLGEGFDSNVEVKHEVTVVSEGSGEWEPVTEAWHKSLEIRVVDGSRLQIRPFVIKGTERVFLPSDGTEIRFGDRVLIGDKGFRKVFSGESLLLKKYLGWKTYFVESTEVPAFIQKFGVDLASNPLFDIDPIVKGKHQAVNMEEILLQLHGKAGSKYQVGIQYRTGKGPKSPTLDLAWLKSQWDSKQFVYLTLDGWIDFTSFEWSWLKQVKLENWVRLEDEWTVQLDTSQLFRLCALHRPQTIRLKESMAFPEMGYLTTLGNADTSQIVPHHAIPSEGLRPYQKEGLQWLSNLVSYGLAGLLADDMGLGKTHQVMALLAWNHKRYEGKTKSLVVCPTSVLYHWKTKLEKFHTELETVVYHGPNRDPSALDKPICITSYGIVRNDIALLREVGYDLLILDEIQFLKNRDSETHKIFRDFPVRSIIGLTGTPLENSPSDVKNLFDLLIPDYFPGEAEFRRSILEPLESGATADHAKARFLGLCRPFILRRTKAEVLTDLPEKVEETSFCDLAENQAALYHECLVKKGGPLLKELQGLRANSLLHVFQLLNHLKQICNHPLSLPGIDGAELDYQSGKWELFLYHLESSLEAGHKVVIFSQYLAMLSRIENHLKLMDIGFASLTGSTRDREGVLKRYESDVSCRVFCCSLKAGGIGIDLTAASTVIHYDRWWNAARENQATDRVHRIGQNRNVQVFKLVTRNTIEEKIDAIIRKKAGWMDSLLPNDAEGGIKLFSKDELVELLTPGSLKASF